MKSTVTIPSWNPVWSTPVSIKSGGRYPLGLNRFHNKLEDVLIKSITQQANYLRYISYCCWAIGDIHRRENIRNYSDFVMAFRMRQTAMAIGQYLRPRKYGVAGSDLLKKVVVADDPKQKCDWHLIQKPLGAFEQLYMGSTYNFGLIENDENGILQLTPSGKRLWLIYESALQKQKPRYYQQYCGKSIVPTDVLCEWGEFTDLQAIRQDVWQEERNIYHEILFRLDNEILGDYRQDSFLLMLSAIDACAKCGISISEKSLQQMQYYRQFLSSNGELIDFVVPADVQKAAYRWRIYEGHVYFRGWLSSYFQCFLNYLKNETKGGTISGFMEQVNWEEFNTFISLMTNIEADYTEYKLADIIQLVTPAESLIAPLSIPKWEEAVTFSQTAETLAGTLFVFANLYARFRPMRPHALYQSILHQLQEHLSFNHLFTIHGFEKMTVLQFFRHILKNFILAQHDKMMYEKRDLRKCWVLQKGDKYYFQADVSVLWRPGKFHILRGYLEDLCFIENVDDIWQLTDLGATTLNELVGKHNE